MQIAGCGHRIHGSVFLKPILRIQQVQSNRAALSVTCQKQQRCNHSENNHHHVSAVTLSDQRIHFLGKSFGSNENSSRLRSCQATSTSQDDFQDFDEGNFFQRSYRNWGIAVDHQVQKLDGLWGKFIPMVALFFLMSFVNTLLDSMKDSLVITAVGGGAEVIPFLTVYGVLPCSFIFLVVYSYATTKFSRKTLFNVIVSCFLCFFAAFATFYPQHEALHLHGFADELVQKLPIGLAGAVGMIRNWGFTLFYCMSELWGDVVMSLLFWGFANDTTSLTDATLLYPLFGIGANVAQTMAGKVLSVFSQSAHTQLSYAAQLQTIMSIVMSFGVVILILHAWISKRFPSVERRQRSSEEAPLRPRISPETLKYANGAPLSAVPLNGVNGKAAVVPSSSAAEKKAKKGKKKVSFWEAVTFLINSQQIRCLAIMACSQGISTNLLEFAWKSHLQLLHPTPGAYAAFMGNMAMWTGIVTGSLMLTSPILFERVGWKGVAGFTPMFMFWAGMPFFLGCLLYNIIPHAGLTSIATLKLVVIGGAVLQVFGKGAKFSMFKPAEEMVYIRLDEESRTKGKAGIDVFGAQAGKSAGSVLQQMLLLISGGAIAGTIPIMAGAYFLMLRNWSSAVNRLSVFQTASMVTITGSFDEDDPIETEGRNGGAPVDAAWPPAPPALKPV